MRSNLTDDELPVSTVFGGVSATDDRRAGHSHIVESLAAGDGVFRNILDALPAAIYVTDSAGHITYYNEAAAALWGYRPEIGKSQWCGSWKLYTPDGQPLPHDQSPMAKMLLEMTATQGTELIAERPDGSRVPFMPYPTLLRDASGALTGAVNMLMDLIGLKRAEDYAQRLASIVEFSDDAIISKDVDGVITSWNRSAAHVFGYTAQEAIGKPVTILVPPGHLDEEADILARIRRGEAIEHYEVVRRRKDGSLVDVSLTVSPVKDAEGRIIGASEIARDVTERRHAEQAAQRLAAIVESSDDAILAKSLDGVITSWNRGAERLFGYTAEEAIGRPVIMLIPLDRRDEEPAILARVRRGEHVDHYETIRQRKDGSLVDISLTVSPIKDAKGKIIGASKVARDISERRRAEERQQLLLGEMDHRIKNLFALSTSVVTLCARAATTPTELASSVRERLAALGRAHALTLSGGAGMAEGPGRSATLHALIQTIVAPYNEGTGQNPTRVAISGLDMPLADRCVSGLALLLHEFTTNAAKYGALAAPGGHIVIECSEETGRLVLTWTERGGPLVEHKSDHDGFGSLLERVTVENQLDGTIAREWRPDGVVIRLSVSRDVVVASGCLDPFGTGP